MLSDVHDTNAIYIWLFEWICSAKVGFPKEVVVDCSMALLNAISLAFNICSFADYLDECFKVYIGQEPCLPDSIQCYLRRDKNHLMGTFSKLEALNKRGNYLKKDYYLHLVGYCLQIEDRDQFEPVITAMFILCSSETIVPGGECWKRKQYLDKKIKGFDYKTTFNMTDANASLSSQEHDEAKDLSDSKNRHVDYNQLIDDQNALKGSLSSKYICSLYNKAVSHCNPELEELDPMSLNNYYFPELSESLIKLFTQFLAWTNVLRKSFARKWTKEFKEKGFDQSEGYSTSTNQIKWFL